MSSIFPVQSSGGIYRNTATKSPQNTADARLTRSTGTGTNVSISDAAREAAKSDRSAQSGIKVPDYIARWFNKDFPPEVMQAAQARLDDIKANGRVGAEGPANLPLLPENQKLLDSFHQEMESIGSAGFQNATPAQSERFNLLMNLSMRLQLAGWEKPMAESDVQREFDISNAMAKLSVNDPLPALGGDSGQVANEAITDMQSGGVPTAWRQRWQKEGLTMPENITPSPDRSMWLDVAQAAGIGKDEFLATLRELAGNLEGHALTHAVESFISERYAVRTGSI